MNLDSMTADYHPSMYQAEVENQQNTSLRYVENTNQDLCDHRVVIIRYAMPSSLVKKAKEVADKGGRLLLNFKTLSGQKALWNYIPGKNFFGNSITCPIYEEWFLVDGNKWPMTSGDLYNGALVTLQYNLKNSNAKLIASALNFNPKFADNSLHIAADSAHPSSIQAMEGYVWLAARPEDGSKTSQWPAAVQSVFKAKIDNQNCFLNVALSHNPNGKAASKFFSQIYHHGGYSSADSLGCSIATADFMNINATSNTSKAAINLIEKLYNAGCPIYNIYKGWKSTQNDWKTTTINLWMTPEVIVSLDGTTSMIQSAGSMTMKGMSKQDRILYLEGRGGSVKKQNTDGSILKELFTTPKNIMYMMGGLIIGLVTGFAAKKIKNSVQGENNSVEHIDTREINITINGYDGIIDMWAKANDSVRSQYNQAFSTFNNIRDAVAKVKSQNARPGVMMSDINSTVSNGWGNEKCKIFTSEIPKSKIDCLGEMAVTVEPMMQTIYTMKSLVNPNSQILFDIEITDQAQAEHDAMSEAQKKAIINDIKGKIV